jgi:signal transduction histidine kinase
MSGQGSDVMAWPREATSIKRWVGGLLAGVAMVAAITGVVALLEPYVPALSLLVLYLLAVLPVAVLWGARPAAVTSVISVAAFTLFLQPRGVLFEPIRVDELVALGVFLVTAIVVAELAARSRRAAVQSARLTAEQSALRRVATLVAQSGPPSTVFEAVTREVGLLCGADLARMERYGSEGSVVGVAAWGRGPVRPAADIRFDLTEPGVAREVRRTGGPVRLAGLAGATGVLGDEARALGIRSSVGCPIVVAGRLWGVIAASTRSERAFPANTEGQIASFTALVATAVENAEARAELRRMADQQTALRRVATLLAQGVAPDVVFASVAREVVHLIDADTVLVFRFDTDGFATLMAACGDDVGAAGTRFTPEPPAPMATVFATGRSARYDTDGVAPEDRPPFLREKGVCSAIAVPITVEGRCWGAISAWSTRGPFPPDTEQRLGEFTELVATAIANAEARDELGRIAAEQAALRRMATLVARGVEPDLVFAAVVGEVGALVDADLSALLRFEADATATYMAGYGWKSPVRPGTQVLMQPGYALTAVRETGNAARSDRDDPAWVSLPTSALAEDIRSAVDVPIVVGGRLWGAINVSSRYRRLPADTEQRLAEFTELIATAIANAEAHTKLTQSRARIVTTADETRRRIERDLHDGAQQRLVSMALQLRLAQKSVPAHLPDLHAGIGQVADDLTGVLEELREISRGLHPAILTEGGLRPALRMLARRSAVPVALTIDTGARYPAPTEIAAYFVVSEALANTAKHADASQAEVVLREEDGALRLCVADDGVGGAQPQHGSGLTGLCDRVEALGGAIEITSAPGNGTVIRVSLPVAPAVEAAPPAR